MPILILYLLGLLDDLVAILESVSINIGNIDVSLYGIARVTIFGSLLFWLGRVSTQTGREIINRQEQLEMRTREVVSKLLEITIFFIMFLLLMQVMGINLTALAVFGGALGVGIGIGLQAIASNFISGIIILLDRSVSIGDYVELEDGRTGVVRQLNLRSTTMETFDGKDIVVPNEKFIVESFRSPTTRTSASWWKSSRKSSPVIRRYSAAKTCPSRNGRIARSTVSAIPASTCSSNSGWRGSTTARTASAATCC